MQGICDRTVDGTKNPSSNNMSVAHKIIFIIIFSSIYYYPVRFEIRFEWGVSYFKNTKVESFDC